MLDRSTLLATMILTINVGFIIALWFVENKPRSIAVLFLCCIIGNAGLLTFGAQTEMFFSGRAQVPNGRWFVGLLIPMAVYFMVIAVPIYFAYSAVRAVTTSLATFFIAMSIGVILILLISVFIGVALMPS